MDAGASYDASGPVDPSFIRLGEMGGKRRKPLHERAGWREMDEQEGGYQKKKPRRGKKDQLDPTTAADVAAELPSFPPAPGDLHEAQQKSEEVVVGTGSGQEGSGAEDRKHVACVSVFDSIRECGLTLPVSKTGRSRIAVPSRRSVVDEKKKWPS